MYDEEVTEVYGLEGARIEWLKAQFLEGFRREHSNLSAEVGIQDLK